MRNCRGCCVQAIEHEGHRMRRQLRFAELVFPLHVQQMIDEIVALLSLAAPQTKCLVQQIAKEAIVCGRYDLGAQTAWQARKEAVQGARQGQPVIILRHRLVVLGNGQRRIGKAARLDAQNAVEEILAGEAQTQL